MEIRLCDITNNKVDIRDYFIVDNGKILINGAKLYDVILDTDKATLHQQMEMFDSKDEMFKKAQAFDRILQVDNQATDEDRITGNYQNTIGAIISYYKECADVEEQ